MDITLNYITVSLKIWKHLDNIIRRLSFNPLHQTVKSNIDLSINAEISNLSKMYFEKKTDLRPTRLLLSIPKVTVRLLSHTFTRLSLRFTDVPSGANSFTFFLSVFPITSLHQNPNGLFTKQKKILWKRWRKLRSVHTAKDYHRNDALRTRLQGTKHANEGFTLALKPRADVTSRSKTEVSVPSQKELTVSKIMFKKIVNATHIEGSKHWRSIETLFEFTKI